jgi:hypothetical protein
MEKILSRGRPSEEKRLLRRPISGDSRSAQATPTRRLLVKKGSRVTVFTRFLPGILVRATSHAKGTPNKTLMPVVPSVTQIVFRIASITFGLLKTVMKLLKVRNPGLVIREALQKLP